MKYSLLEKFVFLSVGAAIVLQFVMPLGFPIVGHDAPIHLNWLEQFPKLFREGNLYPRWMPESFWGFGSPAFYFYPPLAYWCASIISFIFPNNPVAIYQTLGLLATIASVGTCYIYLRLIAPSKRSALVGALVYGVLPYRLLDLYLRNALGEHVAFVFLPLIFWSIEIALGNSKNPKRQVVLSVMISTIGWGGMLLSNIPSSVIAIYSTMVYAVMRAYSRKNFLRLIFPALGSVIGVMVAAIYLLPAAEFSNAIMMSHLWDLQSSNGNSGYALIDVMHGKYRFFYIGLITTLISGGWLAYRFYRTSKNSGVGSIVSVFFILVLIGTIFQIPFLLHPLWGILPGSRLIQFTYRLDILVVLASAVFIALFFDRLAESKWLILASSFVTLGIAGGYFVTMNGNTWKNQVAEGHIDAPEYIARGASNDASRAIGDFRLHANDPLIDPDSPSFHFHLYSETPKAVRFTIDRPPGTTSIALHRMHFPTVELSSNKDEVLMFSDSMGRSCALLENSSNSVSADYALAIVKSDVEKRGELISCAGLAILSVLVVLIISSRNPRAS
ncbi:MAG: 6-pyruvoyl-tetrahydropterin synthase-related protein [Bacteroidota bacterium]|nr:6-pyruvoyl-tetrahydropterin synthase-related protein [Bacteroidota bacterium]MDP4231307.1 6-pyruvoyl-tetrahydropterin synthase-related protein [Bacteroidota bacterium]MDP4235890.1 6-pyruvoyl-tetrahydropterin synthase-related protein [Bacteroidota bacterium]